MKPMFRVFSFTVLTSTLLFSSCVKDLYDPEVIAEKNPDAEIPVGFKFTTIKNVNLTVNVNDEYNGQYFYKVEVYNQNPLSVNNNMKLLTAGVAKGNSPFVEEIVVPLQDSILYIKQIDPLQREIVKVVDISSVTTAVCDFSNNTITTKSVFSSVVTSRAIPSPSEKATAYPLPDNRITLGSGAITLVANTKYYLPYGFTNNQITFDGGSANVELFVEGNVTFSNTLSLSNGCKIVVLPKGSVSINGGTNWNGSGVIVAIHERGTLNFEGTSIFGSNNKIINDGEINAKEIYMQYGTPKIINNGIIKSAIINHAVGIIENNHHIEAGYLHFSGQGGTLNNNCFTICDDLEFINGIVNSTSGSLFACNDFKGHTATINLNGNAIFSIGDVAAYSIPVSNILTSGPHFEHNVVINGVSENNIRPLFYVKSGSVSFGGSPKPLSLKGSLDAAIVPSYDASKLDINMAVTLTKEPLTAIAETSCNGSGATEDPGTGTPTNPSFPIKVETGNAYTFAMEDNWPALGDYDMNDFVFVISNISFLKGNNNKIDALSFNVTPIAAGATNRLALGVQFDNISSNHLTSVQSTDGVAVKENGQEKANLILFQNVYSTFGISSPGITNTDPTKTKYNSKPYTFSITFNSNVSEADININKLNFYLIVGQNNDVNRKEVHLAGYKPTSKVKSDPLDYTDYNNMVWGLLIPTADFKYPIETIKIQDAYPNFLNWAKSGGSNNANWYLSPQSGKVYNK